MNKSILKVITIIASGLVWQVSCFNDTERTNPLDPKSDNFKNVGSVAGQTLTFYSPFVPLSEVEIRIEPGSFVSKSNTQGEFFINNVPVGNYRIAAAKQGYAEDTVSVEVKLGQTTQVQMNLDGLPVISSNSIISGHISRWWPQNDLFLMEIMAQVGDPDGLNDIEVVQIQIPQLNFLDTLEVTQSPGILRKTITESQLPGRNLQDVLGRGIFLKAQDRAGSQTTSPPNFLVRILELTPETVSPQGLAALQEPRPLLTWQSVSLPFDFTYRVEVVRVDAGITNLVWTASNIDNTLNSITVADSLVTGTYFWTVSVVDDFGNWSRSKEASFRIE